jgi:serine protease
MVVLAAPPTIPGRLVLKLKPNATPAAVLPALAALGMTSVSQKFPKAAELNGELPGGVDLRLIYQIEVPATATLAKARTVLLSTGLVEYVEPLYIREPLYQPNDPLADSVAGSQDNLKLIQAYRAWDFTKGDSSVVIGLTDTGMRPTHEELVRKIKYNYADPINGLDDDHDGYVDNFRGWDMANGNNDPTYNDRVVHGSQVAGVLAAQADNGKGVAGVGFNSKFLPIQIFPGVSTGVFAGYEAIVYAADHGCKVINMSWGGIGGYSRFEQDVCTYAAVNKDVVLVAAAGNTNAELLFYPASYEHVLSVSATDAADAKAPFATYSRRIDLTAPGVNIRTTNGLDVPSIAGPLDADYWLVSGTSIASPQVAGAAALVRARFPELTAEQVAAQLRQSADTTVRSLPANVAYRGRLGTGRLNVARAVAALNYQEARVVTTTFAPALPAGYAPGATVQLTSTVRNLLQPMAGLTVTLTSLSPYLTVQQGSFMVGSLFTLGQSNNAALPFRVAVAASGVPLNTIATLRYRLTAAGGYQSDQYVDVRLNPDFVVLDAGDLVTSLSSRGNLAYDEGFDQGGLGLSYRTVGPLLSEGGLLLATSPTRVADHLRAAPGKVRQSFYTEVPISRLLPGPRADQEATSTFRDSLPTTLAPRSVGVRVRQRGLAWSTAGRRNFIILEYSLKNITADTLKPLYAGLFTDWDLPGETSRNVARYDSVLRLGYCYDPLATRLYAGVQVLGSRPAGVYSIDNNAPDGTPVNLKDGFSPAEKYLTLHDGFGRAHRSAGADLTGADVSQVLSTMVARLAPGDSATVAFAVLAAPTLPELQAAAHAAVAAYAPSQPLATAPAWATTPTWQVYPNPSQGLVRVEVPWDFGPSTAQLLDGLGRQVGQQALGPLGGELRFGSLPTGIYTLRLVGHGRTLVRQLVKQ